MVGFVRCGRGSGRGPSFDCDEACGRAQDYRAWAGHYQAVCESRVTGW